MTCEVIAGPPIVEYLQRIDGTLAPFGGRFIVHGVDPGHRATNVLGPGQ